MIYDSIQNVIVIGTTGRKIEDQVNCTFLSKRSSKRKNEMPLQVSDVMINARARAIDSVTEKKKHLLTIKRKSQIKSFDVVTYQCKFGGRYEPHTSR